MNEKFFIFLECQKFSVCIQIVIYYYFERKDKLRFGKKLIF